MYFNINIYAIWKTMGIELYNRKKYDIINGMQPGYWYIQQSECNYQNIHCTLTQITRANGLICLPAFCQTEMYTNGLCDTGFDMVEQ